MLSKVKLYCPCGNVATWDYQFNVNKIFCDDCVPRGCSCNNEPNLKYHEVLALKRKYKNSPNKPKFKKYDGIWQQLDENGQFYPCCEYNQITYVPADYKEVAKEVALSQDRQNLLITYVSGTQMVVPVSWFESCSGCTPNFDKAQLSEDREILKLGDNYEICMQNITEEFFIDMFKPYCGTE